MAKKIFISLVFTTVVCAIFFWATKHWYINYGLSPEEQLEHLHKTAPLKGKLLDKLTSDQNDTDSLNQLVDVLVLEGNLGRADALCRIYGLVSTRMDEVIALCKEMDDDAKDGTLDNRKADERWMSLVDWPVYGALRFKQGYRFAILGDWKSAMNEMLAIKNPKSGIVCPPLLKDYVDYLLARAYQEDNNHEEAMMLLKPLMDSSIENGLVPKIYTSTIASALALKDMKSAESAKIKLEKVNRYTWEKAKASVLFGNYYKSSNEPRKALNSYVEAIENDKSNGAIAKEALSGICELVKFVDNDILIDSNSVMNVAECAANVDMEPEAISAFSAIAQKDVSRELKCEAALASHYLYLELGQVELARSELVKLNLSSADDIEKARALYQLAIYEKKKRDFGSAANHFKESAALRTQISAESRWELYLLSKANKTNSAYNMTQAIKDLEFIVDHSPRSARLVEAAEELLPIYFFQGTIDKAEKLISLLDGQGKTAEVLQAYWTYRLAEKSNDKENMAKATELLAWRSYSFYELYVAESPYENVSGLPPILHQPENVDEIFFGMGLFDLGRESSINAERENKDISLASEVFARANHGTPESAAWYSEKLLEKGVVTAPELVNELIQIAFPRPFEQEVRKSATRHRVSPALVWATMKKESAFKPEAVSSVGARGLMQIMPDTASWLINGGRADVSGDWRTDPASNIELGCAYLAHLKYERTAHQPDEVIISAYNAGPGNANAWATRFSNPQGWLYAELIPNTENEVFTKKVLKYELIYKMLESES